MPIGNLDIQEQVIEELAFDPTVTSNDIAVTASNGVITLRGTVPNLTEKWNAVSAVKRVRGVRGIADELDVELPFEHRRDDSDIAFSIERRFTSSTVIPSTVTFVVKDGFVTLGGDVPWNYQREAAASEAGAVLGVRSVANEITVKPGTQLDPDQIKRKIRSEFARQADLDANHVTVDAATDEVILTGTVRTWFEHDKATQVAWSMPGVKQVKNRIVVTT